MLPAEIFIAVHRGELQEVVEWLEGGGHADALDEEGRGLLHLAARLGDLSAAEGLLSRGGSVDLRGFRLPVHLVIVVVDVVFRSSNRGRAEDVLV